MRKRDALLRAAQLYERLAEWNEEEPEEPEEPGTSSLPEVKEEDQPQEEAEEPDMSPPPKRLRGCRAGRAVQQQKQKQWRRGECSARTSHVNTKKWQSTWCKISSRIEVVDLEQEPEADWRVPVLDDNGDACPDDYFDLSRKMARLLRYGDQRLGIPSKAAIEVDRMAELCQVRPEEVRLVVQNSYSKWYPRFMLTGRAVLATPRG